MKIFCSEDIFGFQSYWNRYIPHGNFRLLFGNSMVVIQTLFTNLIPLCHYVEWSVHWLTVTYDWFPVVLSKSWRVSHVGQEMLTLSGTHDFTPFFFWGVYDFTHSIYIYIVYYWSCQFKDYCSGYKHFTLIDEKTSIPLSVRSDYIATTAPYLNIWCLQYFPLIQRRQRNRHTPLP